MDSETFAERVPDSKVTSGLRIPKPTISRIPLFLIHWAIRREEEAPLIGLDILWEWPFLWINWGYGFYVLVRCDLFEKSWITISVPSSSNGFTSEV